MRVMIVDDSTLARMALASTVATLYPNLRQIEARNADAAMGLVLAEHIDIALIDYNMPGRDGLSLAADLRDLYPETPMALISGNFQAGIIDRVKELNLTFLQKPRWHNDLAIFLSNAIKQLGG
ncbi:response regulator transcription factor [Acidisphaera sp. S103]|uniref:response regulator transcription factor n=1 Tax=Acidisphaera sp. S103 TaxID=1747223 RepID=UPI00131B2A17|nr:response regulator [Acidisphaera sp. S103]